MSAFHSMCACVSGSPESQRGSLVSRASPRALKLPRSFCEVDVCYVAVCPMFFSRVERRVVFYSVHDAPAHVRPPCEELARSRGDHCCYVVVFATLPSPITPTLHVMFFVCFFFFLSFLSRWRAVAPRAGPEPFGRAAAVPVPRKRADPHQQPAQAGAVRGWVWCVGWAVPSSSSGVSFSWRRRAEQRLSHQVRPVFRFPGGEERKSVVGTIWDQEE